MFRPLLQKIQTLKFHSSWRPKHGNRLSPNETYDLLSLALLTKRFPAGPNPQVDQSNSETRFALVPSMIDRRTLCRRVIVCHVVIRRDASHSIPPASVTCPHPTQPYPPFRMADFFSSPVYLLKNRLRRAIVALISLRLRGVQSFYLDNF